GRTARVRRRFIYERNRHHHARARRLRFLVSESSASPLRRARPARRDRRDLPAASPPDSFPPSEFFSRPSDAFLRQGISGGPPALRLADSLAVEPARASAPAAFEPFLVGVCLELDGTSDLSGGSPEPGRPLLPGVVHSQPAADDAGHDLRELYARSLGLPGEPGGPSAAGDFFHLDSGTPLGAAALRRPGRLLWADYFLGVLSAVERAAAEHR